MLNNSPRDNDIAQLKREVRARIIAQRDALAPALRSRKSHAICTDLADAAKQALPTRMSRQPIVAVYSPMGSEVDLGEFIAALYNARARVAFPAMLPDLQDGQRMQMRIVSTVPLRLSHIRCGPFRLSVMLKMGATPLSPRTNSTRL